MCLFKKKKIRNYLSEVGDNKSTFDMLLEDYLSGELKGIFQNLGLTGIELGVDLFHTIWMQAKYGDFFVEVQMHSDEFGIAVDLDEADDDVFYPLKDKADMIEKIMHEIKKQSEQKLRNKKDI